MMKWLVRGVLGPWQRRAGRGRQVLALTLATLVAGAGAAVAFAGAGGDDTSASSYSTSTSATPSTASAPETPSSTSSSGLVSLGESSDDTYDSEDTWADDYAEEEDSSADYEDSEDESTEDDYSEEGDSEGYSDESSDESEDSSELTYPILVSAASMIEFTQNSGNPGWADNAQSRLLSVEIEFREDGTFTLDADDSAALPLDGTYTTSGSELSFEGSAGSAGSNGSSNVEVLGTVDLDDETMNIDWIATGGMSAYVNDTGYVSSNAASYTAELDVYVG